LDFDSFDKPRRVKKQPKKIDEKHLRDCINEIDNRKHKALISLAYSSGMWLGEIIALKLTDIDFDKNLIIVRNKDASKHRIIATSKEINEILIRYIRKFTPVEYLFNGQNKPQYSKKSALNALQKCVGMEYNFHLLRNTHIYNLIESGNDLKKINEHLGTAKGAGVKRLNFYKKHSVKGSTRIKPPM
jgi:integrase